MSLFITLGTSSLEITSSPTLSNSKELITKKHITGVFPFKFYIRGVGDVGWTYPYNSITKIRIFISDGRRMDIELQSVTNQPTWNDGTDAALQQAINDINIWLNNGVIPSFIQASGGEITYSSGRKIHKIKSTDVFIVTSEGSVENNLMRVESAGGGGGGCKNNGGARAAGSGGGGVKAFTQSASIGSYTVTIGTGGTLQTGFLDGGVGGDTIVFGITAKGGGGSGGSTRPGVNGASGGGGGNTGGLPTAGGTGILGQGNSGGQGIDAFSTGGGGGYSSAGGDGSGGFTGIGGDAGAGYLSLITGEYFGVGGSGSGLNVAGAQGSPGGGIGGAGSGNITEPLPNTGNGGVSGFDGPYGCVGSDGVVVIDYIYNQYVNTDLLLELNFPTLTDTSGNGLNSTLGAGLINGFTAPSNVSGDLVFSGNSAIKLNSKLFTNGADCTIIVPFSCTAQEVVNSLINIGLDPVFGMRNAVYDRNDAGSFNRWSHISGVYATELSTTEPAHGHSLSKLSGGNHLVAISFSKTKVIMYHNGMISYFSPNIGTASPTQSGWLGGFPGGTISNYSLPFNGTLLNGTFARIYNRAMNENQLQTECDSMINTFGWSRINFRGDSITEGFTLTTNGASWPSLVTDYLNANTSYKFAPLNIGIPSRTLQSEAAGISIDGQVVPFDYTGNISINSLSTTSNAKNVTLIYYGINDIAIGRTLSQMNADLATIVAYEVGLNRTVFVCTITGDSSMNGTQEALRQSFNSDIISNAASLNYIAIDVAANANLGPQPSGPNSYFSDGVHLTTLGASTLAGVINPVIVSNI